LNFASARQRAEGWARIQARQEPMIWAGRTGIFLDQTDSERIV
jgi:hypothetical protein